MGWRDQAVCADHPSATILGGKNALLYPFWNMEIMNFSYLYKPNFITFLVFSFNWIPFLSFRKWEAWLLYPQWIYWNAQSLDWATLLSQRGCLLPAPKTTSNPRVTVHRSLPCHLLTPALIFCDVTAPLAPCVRPLCCSPAPSVVALPLERMAGKEGIAGRRGDWRKERWRRGEGSKRECWMQGCGLESLY